MTRRISGPQVFVDETKSRDYIMAAAAMLPGDVTTARKRLTGLLLPGQERLHFTHERESRRRQLMSAMCGLDLEVTVYVARTRDHVAGRRACMKAILDDVIEQQARMLTLELDESVQVPDRRIMAERFRLEAKAPEYRHLPAKSEPLLWVPDAVAWCHQRGGEWRTVCEPIVRAVHEL